MTYIIILTWNGKKYLSNLFASLLDLDYSKEKFKILVVDSGSTDGSLDLLESLEAESKIELIKLKENLGFAGGNNVAMKHALDKGAKYIILLNQDTEVKPDFLTKLIETAETDNQIGIIQPLILHLNDKNKIQSWGNQLHYLGYGWCGGNWLKLNSAPVETKEITYASGAAVLYTAKMLREVGLFDENYFSYNEDADLCFRAKLKNYKVILEPKAIVYHDFVFPTDKNKLRYFWMEKNRLYLIKKFYTKKTLTLISPMKFFMSCGQLIFAIKKGYFSAWLKSRFWFLFNFKKLKKERNKIQKTRQISDKELTKDFKSEIKYQPVNNFLLDKIGNPIMKAWWVIIKNFI